MTLASTRACGLILVLALLLGACTGDAPGANGGRDVSEDPAALAEDAAEQTLDALTAADADGLSEVVPRDEAARFLRRLAKIREAGAMTGVGFARTGDAVIDADRSPGDAAPGDESPGATPMDELSAEVPFEVTWTSKVGDAPVTFEGSLGLTRSAGDWVPQLDRSLLFPEDPQAAAWAVELKWLKRGRILDRDGVVLAKGAPESRLYPQGSTAGTTVGHIGTLTRKDVKEGSPGAAGDVVGASGLEEAFQEWLGGSPARRLLLVDRKGKKLEVFGRAAGMPGRDLKTTLDIEVQRAAEAAYGSTTGGSVIIDPGKGDLLAVVSSSAFDPGNYVAAADVEPFNRALSGLYPPGSSLKVMTAGGALDSRTVTASTTVTGPAEYQGVRNFESGAFGSIPFSTAVKFSVNTAFAQVAEDMGAKKLTRYAEAFGFNSQPGIGFAGTSSFPLPEDLGDLMWASVGQAQTLATPMQMASVAATIANGGVRMEPRIAMHIKPKGERAVSTKVARTMTTLMESVVQGGTGVNAQIDGVRIAGKTGTAEVDVAGERKNHAWFVAFAPAGAPELAVSVVSEYGGVGGQIAAPLARSIMQRVLPLL